MIHYVYVLARPDGTPFYVGKGKGRRIHDHESQARGACTCRKCGVIREIWAQGGEVQRYTVFTSEDEQAAFDYERAQIALFGRETLCNQTDGGQGTRGIKPSPATIAAVVKANKERWATPESRAKAMKTIARGDRNGSRLHPDRLKRGDEHPARLHPETRPRGESHPVHLNPELVRGERNPRAKLTMGDVRQIRTLYAERRVTKVSQQALAQRFGVNQTTIGRIIRGELWTEGNPDA